MKRWLRMWVLDPMNSRDLLERLEPHALSPDFDVVWCGEGWRALISACHDELVAAFPDYRFHAIKQKWGVLAFQAHPGTSEATAEDLARVDEITGRYGRASEATCEWCGRPGSLRSDRPEWQTLCDPCTRDLETSYYPSAAPPL